MRWYLLELTFLQGSHAFFADLGILKAQFADLGILKTLCHAQLSVDFSRTMVTLRFRAAAAGA